MTIEYYKKNVYGNTHMYVKDETQAKLLQSLTAQKTLSPSAMEALKGLGFTFEEVLPN